MFCIGQKKPIPNESETKELRVKLDTLKIQNLKTGNDKSDPMPWIVSLLIAGATVAINIYISNKTQKTSIINVEAQIKSSTQNAENQLKLSRDIVVEQINNSQELAFSQFKATLKTKNRQDWINTLQHCTSEFLSQCFMINITIKIHSSNATKFFENITPHLEKMTYNRSKIAMLINVENQDHLDLIKPMDDILNTWSAAENEDSIKQFRDNQAEIIAAANKISKANWAKIKDISR